MKRRIYRPETKVGIAAGYGIPWERIVAVSDELTDVPLLDCAGLSVLVARRERASVLPCEDTVLSLFMMFVDMGMRF